MNDFRILVTDPVWGAENLARLATHGVVHQVIVENVGELILALSTEDPHALIVPLGVDVSHTVLEAAPSLRWIASPTTGLQHVAVSAALGRGIEVVSLANEPEILQTVTSTAEHAFTLLLSLARNLPLAFARVSNGGWDRRDLAGIQLRDHVLGIVGYGRLGTMMAGYGRAFGMRVMAHDTNPEKISRIPIGEKAANLFELLEVSDFVSLHASLNSSSRELINSTSISHIQPHSFLINSARGELINEGDLLSALMSNDIAGAALDVLAGDSSWSRTSPGHHDLIEYSRNHRNLLLTPHIGGYAFDAIATTRKYITDELINRLRRENYADN